jgi:hypothetical protein
VSKMTRLDNKVPPPPPLSLLLLDPSSGIRDPGWIKTPGSGINIPDPQHCLLVGAVSYWLKIGRQ